MNVYFSNSWWRNTKIKLQALGSHVPRAGYLKEGKTS
jgi:hypothetical protein